MANGEMKTEHQAQRPTRNDDNVKGWKMKAEVNDNENLIKENARSAKGHSTRV